MHRELIETGGDVGQYRIPGSNSQYTKRSKFFGSTGKPPTFQTFHLNYNGALPCHTVHFKCLKVGKAGAPEKPT